MQPGEELKIPELRFSPIKEGCGRITYLAEKAGNVKIFAIETRRIDLFTNEQIVITSTGQRLIVMEGPERSVPNDVDGVLRANGETRELEWVFSRRMNEARAAMEKDGVEGLRSYARDSWRNNVRFVAEEVGMDGIVQPGLRPPQVAAMHAIAAHWTLETEPATVVMPTGTGKTETTLGALVALVNGTLLIAVPTKALVGQTVRKCETLGLLHELGVLPGKASYPVVGVFHKRPKSVEDLAWLTKCNVVIGTINTLAQGTSEQFLKELARRCSHLVLDEAHHVAATTWSGLRDAFGGKPVLQLTATPFRRDGKQVEGKIIFNYPLSRAQAEGYFKKIHFKGINGFGEDEVDRKIANTAIKQLRDDLGKGFDHLVMARCDNVTRAERLLVLYDSLASDLHPILVHYELPDAIKKEVMRRIQAREVKVVICVDMLGEGFDLPQLKIAALHDPQKNLATLLQFTGRFTRTSGAKLGDATVIANMDDPETPTALERLYGEDADWNKLLADYSFEAVSEQERLLEFLRGAERLDEPGIEQEFALDARMFRPLYSTLVYACSAFNPRNFYTTFSDPKKLRGVWLFERQNVLMYVTVSYERPKWVRSQKVKDVYWALYVVYFNPTQHLLYIHSTNKVGLHEELAKAIGGEGAAIVRGEQSFRVLGGIKRLLLQNVGLKARGRRNLSYSMFSGVNVVEAVSPAQRARSTRANIFGSGFEHGGPVDTGCSYKGRIWSREAGTLTGFTEWCTSMGAKLLDETISVEDVISGALVPKEVQELPSVTVLSIEWPGDIWTRPEDRVLIGATDQETSLTGWDIKLKDFAAGGTTFTFALTDGEQESIFALTLHTSDFGFSVNLVSGPDICIVIGSRTLSASAYFEESPPVLLFVDGSELEGHFLIEQKTFTPPPIPLECLVPEDWEGVDITVESTWKHGVERRNSVQTRVAQKYVAEGYEFVFDDDSAGEAADLVCIKETDKAIELDLVHCKFSSEENPGRRLSDVVEVASQAVRAVRWLNRFDELCKHLRRRSEVLADGRPTRFIEGDGRTLNKLQRASKVKPVRIKIIAVQPGLSKGSVSGSQALTVLSSAHNYLLETADVGLIVRCSP